MTAANERDLLNDLALKLILEAESADTHLIARKLGIPWYRAGRMMDAFEADGYVGDYQGSAPRRFLIEPAVLLERLYPS